MDPVLTTDGGSDQTGGGIQRWELGDGDCGSDRGRGMHIAACSYISGWPAFWFQKLVLYKETGTSFTYGPKG